MGRVEPRNIEDKDGEWQLRYYMCPACHRVTIQFGKYHKQIGYIYNQLVRPKAISREPLPPEVPSEFADDYREACIVFVDSPKASAALSRRCLQSLLRDKARTSKQDLIGQIQEVLDAKTLPSYLAENLDVVRNIGNFAAHPTKSKSTGEIVDIEPGEAEWNLDILEGLFDFYFVQPHKLQEKREKLNQKLKDVGKPPIK